MEKDNNWKIFDYLGFFVLDNYYRFLVFFQNISINKLVLK